MAFATKIGRSIVGHDVRMLSLHSSIGGRRNFSVKELPWCAPKDSPVRRNPRHSNRHKHKQEAHGNGTAPNGPDGAATKTKSHTPIDAFGIVAGMCRPSSNGKKSTTTSGIIGVNGKLPWGFLPSDRKIFERLTRNRILVVGRRTLLDEEDGGLDHVRHAKYCIVVSTSIANLEGDPRLLAARHEEDLRSRLRLARSLDEALDIARVLAADEAIGTDDAERKPNPCTDRTDDAAFPNRGVGNDNENNNNNNNNNDDDDDDDDRAIESIVPSSSATIPCWVAGGERLYEEALKHKSALELHLSVVDLEIDPSSPAVKRVARFPAKYRWDHNYQQHAAETVLPLSRDAEGRTEPSFVYHVYKRIVRND